MTWAPFIGVFIARISKGRSVREFVSGVLLVPATVSILWFAGLGGTGLHQEIVGSGGIVDAAGDVDQNNALFRMLGGCHFRA